MVPALILAISVVALLRFALSYWRATLVSAADHRLSPEVRAAARLERERVTSRDYAALAGVLRLTPGSSAGVNFVGFYYHIVEGIGYIAKRQTAIANWAEREMTICAQYVAVQVDRRLQLSLGHQV